MEELSIKKKKKEENSQNSNNKDKSVKINILYNFLPLKNLET